MTKKITILIIAIACSINVFSQRNVVLIIADDLSADYFGFYENHVDTVDVPNIRALLSHGVRFTNYMANPVCSATRTAILTGRYGFRTGVGGIVGGGGGSGQIDTAEITIPRLLKLFNPTISKANIGKWHLNQPMPASNLMNPITLGYDHFEGPFIGALPNYANWVKYTNGVSSNVTNYATSENVNNAITWLKSLNTSNPFFLWLAFNAPHEPLHLPPAGLHTYTGLSGTSADINANPKSYFKAMIQAMDHEMGRLFDSLQAMNKLDSTDIIFIGDNGNTSKTAQIANIAHAKGTLYQYGVNVPLIISGPSVINPNRVSPSLVNSVDLFATILELFGHSNWSTQIPIAKPVDSKSIMPIIQNIGTVIRPWSFSEYFKLTPDSTDGKAMRNMDYKFIRFAFGDEEFYRLSDDSLESNNLLNGTMTTTDIVNYYELCQQLTTLVGTGNFCSTGVNTTNVLNDKNIKVYPNPFKDQINLNSIDLVHATLSDCFGRVVYTGTQITKQSFINLPSGIYFIQIKQIGQTPVIFKLVKE